MSVEQAVAGRWLTGLLRRQAKYSPEFLQWTTTRLFRSPTTGNRIKFESLPYYEQARIHKIWAARKQQPEEEGGPRTGLPLNADPERYKEVELIADDDERKKVGEIFGVDPKDGEELKRRVLDLAGMNGLAKHVDRVDFEVRLGGRGPIVLVDGIGDHGLAFDRRYYFAHKGNELKPDYIENENFEVDEDAPPGMATRMLASQVAAAERVGFDSIEVYAAGEEGHAQFDGYYVWPRLGFNGRLGELELPEEIEKEVKELAELDGADQPMFTHLMMSDAGRAWWKEEGDSVKLDFPLDPKDPLYDERSRTALQGYLEARAKKDGVSVDEWMAKVARMIVARWLARIVKIETV